MIIVDVNLPDLVAAEYLQNDLVLAWRRISKTILYSTEDMILM